jgi:ABC-type transport system involved in multi-copper enzyme maturation permease subunit
MSAARTSRIVTAIALNTFREAVRDRVLYLLLVFALLVILAARLLSLVTVGSEEKIVKDLGLSAISLFGVAIAVFVGVSLVFKEIERRTVYTLLAQPVRRWQFVVAKFAGLFTVLAVNVAVMYATLAATLALHGASPAGLAPAVWLILVELGIVTAFALLFSSLTNPILAAVWTGAIYVAGHLVWSLRLLAERVPPGAARWLCEAGYWLLPNLDRLDRKADVVHGLASPPGFLVWATAYGACYAAVVLALACAAFARREFR